MARRESLRSRVRAAGGWYRWANANLIRVAGPPQIGPWGEEREGRATARGCPECGHAWDAHETLHVLGRAKLVCPSDDPAIAPTTP